MYSRTPISIALTTGGPLAGLRSSVTMKGKNRRRDSAGADTMIDRVVADIPDTKDGFTLIFSSTPFPGHQYRLDAAPTTLCSDKEPLEP